MSKKYPDKAPKEVLESGTMGVVNSDLKNIMFWAKYGIEKARGGSDLEDTLNAIESYAGYLGYGEVYGENKPIVGKHLEGFPFPEQLK